MTKQMQETYPVIVRWLGGKSTQYDTFVKRSDEFQKLKMVINDIHDGCIEDDGELDLIALIYNKG